MAGTALLELIIVLPMLLLLFTGHFTSSRSLRFADVGSFLSREAATRTFRICRTEGLSPAKTAAERDAEIGACLDGVASGMNLGALTDFPQLVMVLSVYDWNGSGAVLRKSSKVCTPALAGRCSEYGLKLDVAKITTKYKAAIENTGSIIAAEMYVVDDGLQGFLFPEPRSYYAINLY